jgi:hypothetical protein
VGIFRPLSRAYSQALDHHNHWDRRWIHKADFIDYYVEARQIAITPANIKAAFQTTGIIPYNPSLLIKKIRYIRQGSYYN